MTVDSILQKLYKDPAEVEKLAQEQLLVKEQVAYAEKVAEEAGYDISAMNDDQKLQLLTYLSQQLQALEAQQAQGEQPQTQVRPDVPQHAEQAQAVTQQQPVSEDFQMKVAENMYFGEQFGEVAAYKFAQTVLPILEEMRKLAEMFGEKKEEEKEDKKDKKESSFEALAKAKAEEIKKEAETKKLAFDQLVEQRAREILAGK
jgi:hypothetical protein